MKKIMSFVIVSITLLINGIAGYAQTQQSDIEKSVETAAASIRSALLSNQNIDISAHIDTLEKYLHEKPVSLKLSVKYFAIFTLNGYYLEKQIPKVNYDELIEATMVTQKFDAFYDPFYINCAYGLGMEYENRGLYARAVDAYELTLKAFAKVNQGNHSLFDYNIQKRISQLYYLQLGNIPEWLVAQEKAVDIIEQISGQNNESYIKDLDELSLAYQLNNQYEKSDSCLFIRQNYFEKNNLQHSPEYIETLDERASVKRMLPVPQYKEAINLYEKILSLQTDGMPEYANTLYEMAMCYREQENLKQAKFYADISANIAQKNQDENIDLLFNLIQLYKTSNGIEQARALINNISFDPKDNLSLLSKMAYIYALIDDYQQSRKYVEQAKIQADKRIASEDNTLNFSNELGDLSNALLVLGEYEDVIKYQEISLNITKQAFGEDHSISRKIRIFLVGLYSMVGNYDKALDLLEFLTQNKDAPDYLEILHNQADLYSTIGSFDKAISIYETILSYQLNPLTKCNILLSLSGCYVSKADLLKEEEKNNETINPINNAREYALQLLNLSKEEYGTNSEQYILSLNQTAAVYCLLDSFQIAREYADNCLNVINENHFGDSERASYLGSLAFVYAEMKDFSKAIELGEEIKKIQQKINNEKPLEEYYTLFLLSESYLGNHNFERAQYYYTGLYKNLIENIQKNFSYMTGQQRENYLRVYQSQLYNAGKFIDISNSKDSFSKVVYDVSLFSKGLLLRTTNDIREAVYSLGNRSLINDFEQLGSLRQQIDALQQKGNYDKDNVQTLENQADSLDKAVTQASQAYRNLKADMAMTWQDVQKQLKPDEAAVEFVNFRLFDTQWTDSTMYAALVLRPGMESPAWIPLCEQKDLESVLQATVKEDSLQIKNLYNTKGKKLYQLVWQALEKELPDVKTVYYSPSGLLYKIAFNALPTENENVLLSDKYNLHLLSSTREIARLKKETTAVSAQDTTVVYGGLTYDRQQLAYHQPEEQSSENDDIPYWKRHRAAELPDAGLRSGFSWDTLPGTRKETKEIVSLLKSKHIPSQYYTDDKGTEESFKQLSGTKTGVIHLSTHGFFLPDIENKVVEDFVRHLGGGKEKPFENPLLRSGLIMSGANDQWLDKEVIQDDREDGILTADEIARLNLTKTKLVVMSACETGLGDVKNSEGVFGLQRAFKLAGVESLIMSLWKVPDNATAELMTTFYQQWLSGQSKQNAFKNAQQKVREKYKSPYYWAAFVMMD